MLNDYIRALELSERQSFYRGFSTAMLLTVPLVLALLFWKRRTGLKNSLFILLIFYLSYCASTFVTPLLSDWSNGMIPGKNLGIAFAVFVPLAALLLKLCRVPVLEGLDLLIPVFVLGRGIGILGCLFTGCCHGAPVSWGIYSHHAETTVLPAPLFDTLLSAALSIGLWLNKKRKPGEIAVCTIAGFGLLRYVIDVLRDNEKAFSLFGTEGLFGIVYFLTGMIFRFLLSHTKSSAANPRN